MTLEIGMKLGHYTVQARIGQGGMGEVYRALDERLARPVAIKLLHRHREGADDLARFEREVRTLASLDHPGIAIIHGFEEAEGRSFAVLELVDGETLASKLARGPLALEETLRILEQVADALAAAHARDIVHQDLKPSNIMVRPNGRVKILDFGLARSITTTDTDIHSSDTVTSDGILLGTPAYMSPEQVRGLPVDTRADVWAFGCVLFETLTGQRVFPGATAFDSLAAVLRAEPAWSVLPVDLPVEIRSLLERCLTKEREARIGGIEDVRRVLSALIEGDRRTTPGPPMRLAQVTFASEVESMPAWSPDGTRLVYVRDHNGVRKLYVQSLDGEARQLTSGDHEDLQPVWSPDGSTILFVRARTAQRRLEPRDVFGAHDDGDVWAIDLTTGQERRWLANAFNPTFAPDGSHVAVDASWAGPRRIWVVDHRGHNPVQWSEESSEAVLHIRPRWSPSGRQVVFQRIEQTRFTIRIVEAETRRTTAVADSSYADLQPTWSAKGDAIFFSSYRSGGLNIWRLPLRGDRRGPATPVQVTTGAGQDLEATVATAGGRIAFTTLRQNASVWTLPVDPRTAHPTGSPAALIATSREDSRAAWSPDGTHVAFNSDRAGDMNLWLFDVGTRKTRQLTRGPGGDYQAAWSPDARSLAFFSSRKGTPGIWTIDLETSKLEHLSCLGCIEINPFFSPDGSRIAFMSDREGRLELWVMRADGADAKPITHVGVMGHFLRWTADGRAILFRCPNEGRPVTLRVPADGGEPEPVGEIAGGAHMSFSPDGTRILDVVGHKTLYVSTLGGTSCEAVFEFEDAESRIDYPVWSPDGRRVSFDRFRPQGGDIWILENPA